jgi:hypothetical protein
MVYNIKNTMTEVICVQPTIFNRVIPRFTSMLLEMNGQLLDNIYTLFNNNIVNLLIEMQFQCFFSPKIKFENNLITYLDTSSGASYKVNDALNHMTNKGIPCIGLDLDETLVYARDHDQVLIRPGAFELLKYLLSCENIQVVVWTSAQPAHAIRCLLSIFYQNDKEFDMSDFNKIIVIAGFCDEFKGHPNMFLIDNEIEYFNKYNILYNGAKGCNISNFNGQPDNKLFKVLHIFMNINWEFVQTSDNIGDIVNNLCIAFNDALNALLIKERAFNDALNALLKRERQTMC